MCTCFGDSLSVEWSAWARMEDYWSLVNLISGYTTDKNSVFIPGNLLNSGSFPVGLLSLFWNQYGIVMGPI